jgi:Rps23 Pro-64 3,4-dihydroxylase Tpa1-like proline 4-hydroxylase
MRAKGRSVQASGPFVATNSAGIGIDPTLNPSSMAASFKRFGRIHIPGFLQPASADGFHYMFDSLRISDLAEKGEPLDPAYAAAYAFLNSAAFLDFVRALTGDSRPNHVDAQATRYERGHYLTQHDDKKPSSGRLYAYVLNLTPHWRTDWGGLLNFIDADGHVAEAYSPAWNALNLFRVPQPHAVSCVAPFAGAPRLSITGWVRQIEPGPPPSRKTS